MLDSRLARYLGPLEAEIMAILWELPCATVRLVTERLNLSRPERPLAYTTVMTVTSRLAEKGLLTRTLVGKGYEYRASLTQAEFLAQLSGERVKAVLQEFGELAVAHFLGQFEQLDAEHRRRLLDLAKLTHGEA